MFASIKGGGRPYFTSYSRLQLYQTCRDLFSTAVSEGHPYNDPPKQSPPAYHSKTRPVPISSMHDIQWNNKDHQYEIAKTLRPHFNSQTPHLLRHLYSKCDAIYFWRSLEYWRMAVGEDMDVEVEVGKGYNSGERVTTKFGAYLDYLSLCSENDEKNTNDDTSKDVAYLAQNELFPQVREDIPIPSLCCEPDGSFNVGEGKLYHTMLWMGPENTVSPLHYDPLDNLLIQVVGWKRILLFSPVNSHTNASNGCDDKLWHYAGVDGNQYNTSAVDVENPDYKKYPSFALAPVAFECILGPGDALYIPKKWWHHVRSLEFSVNANIWWR